eukprot:3146485-Alexandrium_andersonii.AAC.1
MLQCTCTPSRRRGRGPSCRASCRAAPPSIAHALRTPMFSLDCDLDTDAEAQSSGGGRPQAERANRPRRPPLMPRTARESGTPTITRSAATSCLPPLGPLR